MKITMERYLRLRSKIRTQLFEVSENAVQNVIQALAWNDSIYRTFNEGLWLAKSNARRAKIPKSLVDYIHRAHIAYVVITLRKLYDEKRKGTQAVNSLRSITQSILDNHHIFTRENYLTYDGTPYADNGNLDWRTLAIVQGRHHQFDLLCRLRAGKKRKPTDRVDPIVPKLIHERTVLRPEIQGFANKFLAHLAAGGNRPDEKLAFGSLTLLRIQRQYRNIIWASQQIGRFLCEPILTEVATPQFDVLDQMGSGTFR